MNEKDIRFIENYEKLLNKGYCNCNEMNCIDNNSPRRILNIVKQLEQENKELHNKIDNAIEYIKKYQQIYDIGGSIEKQIDEFNILASPKRLLEILKDSDVDEY